jgi:hypothetical protein
MIKLKAKYRFHAAVMSSFYNKIFLTKVAVFEDLLPHIISGA